MKKSIAVFIGITFGFFHWSLALAQAKRVDFKGIPMGISAEDFKKSIGLPDLRCSNLDEEMGDCTTFSPGITFADQSVQYLSADFLNDKLASVTVSTYGGTAEIIQQAITAKYGRPSTKYKVQKVTKKGIKYQMTATRWKLPSGDEIAMEDHPQPDEQVFVSLESSAKVAWRKRAQIASPRAKKDI